ncbi:MAG TPA: hypothetical protein VKE51_19360 [Vicinamibacterales bacterium]|nr:hypothetical protein [Vicinamibacterales bacterium]
MARIIVGSYVVRFPVGGYLSWVLQWLVGFQRLGHEVYFVEKAGWPKACYDPSTDTMGDDCSYGVSMLNDLFKRFDLNDRWCFVDAAGVYHGMPRDRVEGVFSTADLFVDMGTHGSWLAEAANTTVRVLVDGDPGYTQMRAIARGEDLGDYDFFYSVGRNVGTAASTVPTMGKPWRPVFDPVVLDLFPVRPACANAAFTTIMVWQPYRAIEYEGRVYGAKNLEFMKFLDLPHRTSVPLEVALSGDPVPIEQLQGAGWRIQNPLAVTETWEKFRDYVAASRGEFTVCKNYYVATSSGFFSDRSAVYLASGRPVVMQDTGLEGHLPDGRGLFTVRSVEEAADAIEQIANHYDMHSRCAHEVAAEYLEASKVLTRLLGEVSM